MNGDEVLLGDFDSESEISGLSDFQPLNPPIQEFTDSWDTQPETINGFSSEEEPPGGVSCMTTAGDPPPSGTWILGSVGGVCQWINTTTCS